MILFWLSVLGIGFVVAKAAYELIKTSNAEPIEGEIMHTNQHLVYLLCIIMYETVNTLSYGIVYCLINAGIEGLAIESFHIHTAPDIYVAEHLGWLLFVRVQFLNLIFLLLITHFKQERLHNVTPVKWYDIFKF